MRIRAPSTRPPTSIIPHLVCAPEPGLRPRCPEHELPHIRLCSHQSRPFSKHHGTFQSDPATMAQQPHWSSHRSTSPHLEVKCLQHQTLQAKDRHMKKKENTKSKRAPLLKRTSSDKGPMKVRAIHGFQKNTTSAFSPCITICRSVEALAPAGTTKYPSLAQNTDF